MAALPANPAQYFIEAFRTGAAIAQAKSKLAQNQQQADKEFSMQADRLAKQARLEDQRLQVTKAYHDQQISLKKQQLNEAAQVNQQKATAAAQKFGQQQQYRQLAQRVDADVDSGKLTEDQGRQAKIRLMVNFGAPSGANANALRAMAPKPPTPAIKPEFMNDPQTGARVMYNPKTGAGHLLQPLQKRGGLTDAQRISFLRQDKKALDAKWKDPDLTRHIRDTPRGESDYQSDQQKLKAIDTQIDAIANPPKAPTDARQRKPGQTYDTPKGPHTWTGTGWRKAENQAEGGTEGEEEGGEEQPQRTAAATGEEETDDDTEE